VTSTHSSATPYVFDLDAGVLCLDFVNTLSSTSGEHLGGYQDLVEFALQSNLVTRSEADRLHAAAERRAGDAAAVLERARALRRALRSVFSAVIADEMPADRDVAVVNRELAQTCGAARIEASGQGYHWRWSTAALDSVLAPIVRSAAEVLVSEAQRALVRECGASDCLWLFLDNSKNRSRQWCSMQVCGNREKARRHYQRQKARRSS
jgi:predicted RNA-binding Zn ribbon-like protein